MKRRCALALLTITLAFTVGALGARGADAAAKPTVQISPASAAPGETVRVQLDNWPQGVVTATTCGNGAKRGAQDCSLIGSQGELVGSDALTAFNLVLQAPPMPCPCVILVSTPTNDITIATPITLNGVASGQTTGSPTPQAHQNQLVVTSSVEPGGGGWIAAFAGPARRTLVVKLRNRGTTTAKAVRIDANVGRTSTSGEHAGSKHIGVLAPGATRTVSLPVTISAPTWGGYTVSGHVYSGGEAVRFGAKASTEPWGLELAVPFLLLVWAQVIRRRHREVGPRSANLRRSERAVAVNTLSRCPNVHRKLGSQTGVVSRPLRTLRPTGTSPSDGW